MRQNKKINKVLGRTSSIKRRDQTSVGFGSTKPYVDAVTKIYHQEINDIGRFVRFAESYSRTEKK